MAAPIIQTYYDHLDQFSGSFQQHAYDIDCLTSQIVRLVDALRSGGWVGLGADRFFKEMDELVLPGLRRLSDALCEGSATAQRIAGVFHDAEQEASRQFEGDGEAGSGDDGVQADTYAVGGIKWTGTIDMRKDIDNKDAIRKKLGQLTAALDLAFQVMHSGSTSQYKDLLKMIPDLQSKIQNLREELALDLLDDIKALRPANWAKLSLDEREAALVQAHKAYAEAYGFRPMTVVVDNINTVKRGLRGLHSKTKITLDDDLVNNADPRVAFETLIHESRHELQARATANVNSYYDYAYVNWNDAHGRWQQPYKAAGPAPLRSNYKTQAAYQAAYDRWYDEEFKPYLNHPKEIDARDAASDILGQLYVINIK